MSDYLLQLEDFIRTYEPNGVRDRFYLRRYGTTLEVPKNVRVLGGFKDSAGITFIKMNNDDIPCGEFNQVSGTRCVTHINIRGITVKEALKNIGGPL